MIIDLNDISNISDLPSDVVIVGAGAVGISLAITLSRRGKKVMLLESGGRHFEQKSQDLNLFTLLGRDHDGILNGRARTIGGSTTLWGGQLVPFSEIDFRKRKWIPGTGWPITYDDIAPYYKKSADLLGLNPDYSDDGDVWASLNIEQVNLGENIKPFLTRWMKETNLFKLFKKELEGESNITLVQHAITKGFESSTNTGFIDKVLMVDSNNVEHILTANKIVISCGTIEASRLMLYAAQVNENLPWSNNKFVGAYFQDHLDLQIAKVIPLNKKLFSQAFDNIFVGGNKYQPKLRLNESFQETAKSLNISSSFIFDSSFSEQLSNMKIFIRSLCRGSVPDNWKDFPSHLKTIFSIFGPMALRYIKDRRILSLSDKGIYLNLHCEQVPLFDSQISLDWSKKDKANMPATNLNWKIDTREIETMASFCEELNVQLQKAGLAKLELIDEIKTFEHSLFDKCRDTNHQCGGLRMATSKDSGVVDKNLKVFDTSNMYIAGAATFPTSSYANSTFHAISLGLRLADELLLDKG